MADTDDVNDPTPLSPRVTAQADRSISPRRDALRRIAAASRSLIEDLVGTDVPPDELVEMAEALEGLAGRVQQDRPRSIYEGLAEMAMSGGEEPLEYFFDHSPLVGLANPLAPPIVIEVLDFVRPIRLQVEPVPVTRALHDAVHGAEAMVPRRGTQLRIDVPDSLPSIDRYAAVRVPKPAPCTWV